MARSKQIADILHDYRQQAMRFHHEYESRVTSDILVRRYADRIAELGLEKLGRAMAGEDTTLLDKRLEELGRRHADRLAWLGIAPYQCPRCEDTGSVNGDYCVCMRRRIYTEYYGAPDLKQPGPTLSDYPYGMLDDSKVLPTLGASARELTRLGVHAFEEMMTAPLGAAIGMLVYGPAGVGKTHLVRAGAHEAALRDLDVLFLHASDVHNLYLKKRLGGDINLHYLETSAILIIDDLGTEPMTNNVTRPSLNRLLEVRSERRLPTVFTTNLNELQLQYGERISSRLYDKKVFTFIQLGGVDLRTGRDYSQQKDRGQIDSGQRGNVTIF